MNIFARILSHGFSLAVVGLLIVGFIYRGELFPDVELPGFPDREVTQVAKSEPLMGDGEVQQSDGDWMTDGAVSDGGEDGDSVEITQDMDDPDLAVAEEESTSEMPGSSAEIAEATETESIPETAATAASTDLPSNDKVDAIPEDDGMSGSEEEDSSSEADADAPEGTTESASAGSVHQTDKESTSVPEPVGISGNEQEVSSPEAEVDAPEGTTESASAGSAQQTDKESTSVPELGVDQGANAVDETDNVVEAAVTDVAVEKETAEDHVPVAESMSDKGATDAAGVTHSDAADQSAPEVTSVYKTLATAREAYWLHDYPLAESSYRKMIELAPDSPDGYGELGNMYFAKGMWDKASSEYYQAGVRLVDAGHEQEARDLLSVIKGLNGRDAEKLEGYIATSTN